MSDHSGEKAHHGPTDLPAEKGYDSSNLEDSPAVIGAHGLKRQLKNRHVAMIRCVALPLLSRLPFS